MDGDVQSYLSFLRENVSELHRLGKEWGMTEEEISACVERALEDEPDQSKKETKMSVARKMWHWIRVAIKWSLKLFCILVVLFIALYVVSVVHPPTEMYISGSLQPYGYAIFRMVRLTTLPLHDYYNISHLYDSECIVENPWFEEPETECDFCEGIDAAQEIVSQEHAQNITYMNQLITQAAPVIFRGWFHRSVSYVDLYELYTDHKEIIDKSVFFFQSSVVEMDTIADLFTPDVQEVLEESEGVSVHWQTKNMIGGQVIRKVFPRPPFVPPESEVALEKTVFLDGPKSDHYELASAFMQVGWYTQAHNDRKVLLAPVTHCRKNCNPIQISLEEKDILMFNPSIYKVIMMPNKKGVSVGFMGSFSAPVPL